MFPVGLVVCGAISPSALRRPPRNDSSPSARLTMGVRGGVADSKQYNHAMHVGLRTPLFRERLLAFWSFPVLIFLSGCDAKPECDSFEECRASKTFFVTQLSTSVL
jgi:hypothetical protein